MAETLDQLAASLGAGREADRSAMLRRFADILVAEEPNDRTILLALRIAVGMQRQLQGDHVALDPASRLQLAAYIAGKAQAPKAARAVLINLALDLCGRSIDDALLATLDDLLMPAVDRAATGFAVQAMAAAEIHLQPSMACCQAITQRLTATSLDVGKLTDILGFLGLNGRMPAAHRSRLVENIVTPLLERCASGNAGAVALALESYLYNQHIKVTERPDHHRSAFDAIAAPMRLLGRAHGRAMPDFKRPPSSDAPKVAFFLHNGHRLAHVEVLLSFLAGLGPESTAIIRPVVYLLYPDGAEAIAGPCRQHGVDVLIDDKTPPQAGLPARFERCRRVFSEAGLDAVVFVSLPLHLDYLTHFQLAPVSIWWSMKFPLPNFPALDGRVFFRTLFPGKLSIEGVDWRGGPLGILPPPAADNVAIAAVRAKYAGGPLLGTIAREEKIAEPAYLTAVVRILQAHPAARFLWTGRHELPAINKAFAEGGVADRCHFIGWVDPAVYSRAFDVFLETFPLTGLMSGWAMFHGIPVASAGRLCWFGTYLEGIFDGSIPCAPDDRAALDTIFGAVRNKLPGIWAKDGDAFVALVAALLGDAALSRDFGLAGQAFMRRYLSDPAKSARIQAEHFRAIIDEAQARPG